MKILSVFGTRPEAIKMAPIINKMKNFSNIDSCVCVTGQHRQLLDQVLSIFEIYPDYDLHIMKSDQSLSSISSRVLTEVEKVIQLEKPDWLLVQGDTTTCMAASLAAFYQKVLIGHVEAGLRTNDKQQPFPEEINRRITDVIADLHFAPTDVAKHNLVVEGFCKSNIFVTGNTIIDAINYVLEDSRELPNISSIINSLLGTRIILVTAHRRENFGQPIIRICNSILQIITKYHKLVHVVYPVHPNPNVQKTVYQMLGNVSNITLLDPLDYFSFIKIMEKSYLIMTDSGGIQEEATILGKPVLVMRDKTERIEAVDSGTAILVGTNEATIMESIDKLMMDMDYYRQMSKKSQIFGDGRASDRIIEALIHY